MMFKKKDSYNWRDYQRQLRREYRWKNFLHKFPSVFFYTGCSALALVVVCLIGVWVSTYISQASVPPAEARKQFVDFRERLAERTVLKNLGLDLAQLTDDFVLERGEERLTVKSSLDPSLQKYIRRLLKGSQTLQAAVVVLDSNDGRVLAMETYRKDGKNGDLCLKADYPAASLFKIVTAGAALESAGYRPNKNVYYRGKRHTLYKSQLKKKTGRWTVKTSFRKAFASSINPVFGKLGIYELGQSTLADYSERFLFNHTIPFDFPVEMSTIQVPEDNFGLAEIASGFNKKTLISPLHAALLASVAANSGVMVSPWLIEHVKNESGEFIYQWKPTRLSSPINRRVAKDLKALMRDTVIYGTCRKSFRPLRRKRAFKKVEFGAKTGTINDEKDQFKYDWLAAYALPEKGGNGICISVLSIHGEKLGIRAGELGRYIINYYLSAKKKSKV
jgi:peptidoglycan glycosyltransferase